MGEKVVFVFDGERELEVERREDGHGTITACPRCAKSVDVSKDALGGITPMECPCGWAITMDLGALFMAGNRSSAEKEKSKPRV